MATSAFQIKLELADSEPEIWRRLIVPSDPLLSDLHKIIQAAMGWTNSHLHQFIKDRQFYEPPPPVEDMWDSSGTDYTGMQFNELISQKNDSISYAYDFGDGWLHHITLEKIIEDFDGLLPVCTDGEMACPPEDIGGIWGFQEFKEIMQDPGHPEYDGYKEWYDGDYDAAYFDPDEVNKKLRKKNYGVIGW